MLDHKLKPQLLEVNQSPSFTTDSPLDYKIKKKLIEDTVRILNLSINRKLRTKGNKKAEMQRRLLGATHSNVYPNTPSTNPVNTIEKGGKI
jgi:tubulin polyglutamylase TTLL6/13